MGIEIEKKFLLKNDNWKPLATGVDYCQGYLSTEKNRTVRLRTIGEKGYLTIKGKSEGAVRQEFEYEIPVSDAQQMLNELCEQPLISKRRYQIEIGKYIWEVDEFSGENEGLCVAEIELEHESQEFVVPDWIGKEVTGDPRYFNSNLVKNPYSLWNDTEK